MGSSNSEKNRSQFESRNGSTDNMPHSKPQMSLQISKTVRQPLPAVQDDLSDNFEGLDSEDPMEKDDTEVELEKLVFGDDAGFHEGLKFHQSTFSKDLDTNAEDQQDAARPSDEAHGLQAVDDADVRTLASTLFPQQNAHRRVSSSSLIPHQLRFQTQT